MRLLRFPVLLLVGLSGLLLSMSGCGWTGQVETRFAAVKSPEQFSSVNGLGVFRRMWESAGAKTITPKRLSPRLDNVQVLVLASDTYGPPGKAAREWIENWLNQKRERRVIYFGRDFNAELFYREKTLAQVPSEEQRRARVMLGKVKAEELRLRLKEARESTFCDWFYQDLGASPEIATEFSGPWKSALNIEAGEWPCHTLLLPPDSDQQAMKPSWVGAKKVVRNVFQPSFGGNDSVERSSWEPELIDTQAAWDEQFDNLLDSRVLLKSGQGTPLIYELTAPHFRNGSILVLQNGAPLLNGTLVQPFHRQLAAKIVDYCGPAERVAFLRYDRSGLLISSIAEDVTASGLKALTVWPLSGITMPAVLLGLIVCCVLFPIFGRPQRVPPRSTTDFGLHVSTLGIMLSESGDANYAKTKIKEYFETVKGERPPEWLDGIVAEPRAPIASSPPPLPSPVSKPKDEAQQSAKGTSEVTAENELTTDPTQADRTQGPAQMPPKNEAT